MTKLEKKLNMLPEYCYIQKGTLTTGRKTIKIWMVLRYHPDAMIGRDADLLKALEEAHKNNWGDPVYVR